MRRPGKRADPPRVRILSMQEFDTMIGVRFETSDDDTIACHVHETDRDTVVVSCAYGTLVPEQQTPNVIYIRFRRG